MNGMEIMMKSLGLDPKAISENIGGMAKFVALMKVQLDRVEAKLDAVLGEETVARINAEHKLPAPTETNGEPN